MYMEIYILTFPSIDIWTVDIYRFRLFDHCFDNYLPLVCFMNLLYNLDIIFGQY